MKHLAECALHRSDLLHIWTLCSFAFAQPLFDLLSRHVAFLVVHRAGLLDLLGLTCLLCLIIPASFIGMELVARAISAKSQKWMHYGNVAFLLTVLSLPALKAGDSWSGILLLGLAGGIGISVAVCYASFSAVRLFFTLLSPAILLFPAVFMLRAEIAPINFSPTNPASSLPPSVSLGAQTQNIPPVVLVVLDELPLTSLLDEHYRIDAIRYPHFATLAQNATWFRNAVTESGSTLVAVPTILSGTGPKPNALPTYEHYPDNIFTLLQRTHELHVFESHTMLCPETLCPESQDDKSQHERFVALIRDLSIVYLHIILPQDYTTFIPAVTQTWKDFGQVAGVWVQTPDMETVRQRAKQFYADRATAFSDFVASITTTAKPGLHVIHVLLPHVPWTYLPSGVVYTRAGRNVPGLNFDTETWDDNAALVRQGYQRHLWQVGLVDKLIGQLLSRLHAVDLYERSLIVMTADHGASFWPNAARRALFGRHAADVRRVPLFFKAPFQDVGAISDHRVRSVDIVPSIVDILGIEPRGWFDGHSLYSVPIICTNGTPTRIVPQNVEGYVDLLEVQGEQMSIGGWAADLTQAEPAARILIFSNDMLIHSGLLNSERQDVVRVHDEEKLQRSGFRYHLPAVPSISDTLRVFAVSRSGAASELRYSLYPKERLFQKQSDRSAVLPTVGANGEMCRQQLGRGSTFLAQMRDFSAAMDDVYNEHDVSTSIQPAFISSALAPLQATLERKLTLFTASRASDSQTKEIASREQYETLRGRSLQEFSIVGASPLHATLDLTQKSFEVKQPVRFVPAHITGALTSGAERAAEQNILAVAINGTIQDVMPRFLGPKEKERFSFLVPENSFQIGPNEPEFFLISGRETAPQLERVNFSWRSVN